MTEDLQKVKDLLLLRNCSNRTISNYLSCINRFKNYYKRKDLKNLNEDDILDYLKKNFVNIGCSAATINVNRAAIKYYYLVNFNKEFSNVLLPQTKIPSRFPKILSKHDFIKMFNSEFNLKHKIWIILAYGSGLRISEVASLKVSDILSKEHKIHIIGKGNKERYAPLPNFTLKLLRIYWIINKDKITNDYLFPGVYVKNKKSHINTFTIKQAFQKIKQNNNLDDSITFHTLRHSYATEFIKSGGDIWELKNILGHSSINTASVYLHMAENFENIYSPLNEVSKMTKFTIQDIFKIYGDEYIKNNNLSKEQWKVFNVIRNCGTKELSYHISICQECGEEYFGFNSCRNRHCPMCQSYAREKWIQKESSYLLASKYFHIITTIPYELNEIFLFNQRIRYNILFKATSESILTLAQDPKWLGAKVGITSILHTWGQTMEFHPHIHSIVTGGGLKNNHWVSCDKDYLFKVQVLGSLFRGKFLFYLKHEFNNLNTNFKDLNSFNKFLEPLYNKTWITYIEPPKGAPENVVEYVGRYSFRVAISNDRIKNVENGLVTFEYKDYKDNSKIKEMTITAEEFIRRFLLHVLPNYFTKIKHYGLLSNRNKKNNIRFCRLLISKVLTNEFISNIKRKFHEFKCEKCGSTKFTYSFNYNINRLCNS